MTEVEDRQEHLVLRHELTEATLTPDPGAFSLVHTAELRSAPHPLQHLHQPASTTQAVLSSHIFTVCVKGQVYCQRIRQLDVVGETHVMQIGAKGVFSVQVFQV